MDGTVLRTWYSPVVWRGSKTHFPQERLLPRMNSTVCPLLYLAEIGAVADGREPYLLDREMDSVLRRQEYRCHATIRFRNDPDTDLCRESIHG